MFGDIYEMRLISVFQDDMCRVSQLIDTVGYPTLMPSHFHKYISTQQSICMLAFLESKFSVYVHNYTND